VVVVQAAPSMTAITSKSLVCLGGSAVLTVTGNATSVSWPGGQSTTTLLVTPPASTAYVVTGTLASTGCTAAANVSVQVYQATVSVSQNTSVCFGSSVTLSAGSASSYSWTTGQNVQSINVSPSTNTVYGITAVITAGSSTCLANNSVSVNVNAKPVVGAVLTTSVLCRNELIVITATGAVNYIWNTGAVGPTISVSYPNTGGYTCIIIGTDANGCKDTASVALKVNSCTGLAENIINSPAFSIYPNPNNGSFTILSQTRQTVKISNALGQVIMTIDCDAGEEKKINEGLAKGLYYIISDEPKGFTRKVMVGD
jgi:hypothetical protein